MKKTVIVVRLSNSHSPPHTHTHTQGWWKPTILLCTLNYTH